MRQMGVEVVLEAEVVWRGGGTRRTGGARTSMRPAQPCRTLSVTFRLLFRWRRDGGEMEARRRRAGGELEAS